MEKEFSLKVTEAELNFIGSAIGKLPFEQVEGLINKLRQQAQQQMIQQQNEGREKLAVLTGVENNVN